MFALFQTCALSATILVDDTTRNGGFETGLESPWVGDSAYSLSIQTGPPGVTPYQGTYFASFNGVGPLGNGLVTVEVYVPIPVSLSNGSLISLNFYAGTYSPQSLETMQVYLSDSSLNRFNSIETSSFTLSAGSWSGHSFTFSLPNTFNDSGNSRVTFIMSRAVGQSNSKYGGYLDSVLVTQSIPEPQTLMLLIPTFSLIVILVLKKKYC